MEEVSARGSRCSRMPDALRTLALLTSLLAVPSLAAVPTVWGESAMVKVRPEAKPRAPGEVQLTAARNEFVSFQVGLHGGDLGLRGVRASLSALEGPTRIAGADVSLYREDLLTTKKASVAGEPVGRWPDALVPDTDEIAGEARRAFPFDVQAGEARALWVDVHVPQDAPPGEYLGTVEVTADAHRSTVPVRLTVVDAELPSTPSLATAFLLWPPHVCRAHTGSEDCNGDLATQVALLQRYHQMALEHRVTLSSAFPRSQALPDWAAWDAAWGPYLDGTAPSRLPGARMTSVEYLGPRTAEGFADFVAHMRERGWLERAYDYVGDEPPYGISFEELRAKAGFTRQVAPELRTLVTTNAKELKRHALEEDIDLAVPLVNHIDGTDANFKGSQRATYADFLRQPGRELWLYQSCMSHGCAYGTNAPENRPGAGWPSYMLDRSAAKARAMEWVSFLEGATGELYYQTVGMLASAWTDQYRFNGNGDGTLFYPGTPERIGGSTHVPVASLRLKLIRLGVQDYEWLKLVSDAGDPAFAHQVARELIPAASRVTDDGEAFERARLKLIQRYVELTGSRVAPPVTVAPPAPVVPAPAPGTPASGPAPSPSEPTSVPPVADAPLGPSDVDLAPQGGCTAGGGTAALGGVFLLAALVLVERWRARERQRRYTETELRKPSP